MKAASSRLFTIAVVDPDSADYESLLSSAENTQLSVHFLSTGNDALWFSQRRLVDLWLIDTALPDMSGFDLAQMLRHRKPSARIFIVGDEYHIEDEVQTLSLGLTKYLCKPLDASWSSCWAQPQLVTAGSSYEGPSSSNGRKIRLAAATLPADETARNNRSPASVGAEMPVILPFVAQSHHRPAA